MFRTRLRNRHFVVLAVALLGGWTSLRTASATNLSVRSDTLQSAITNTGQISPHVVLADSFNRRPTPLAQTGPVARTATSVASTTPGPRWAVTMGTWTFDGSSARADSSDDARLLALLPSTDASIAATIFPGPNADAGVIVNADATDALAVRYRASGQGSSDATIAIVHIHSSDAPITVATAQAPALGSDGSFELRVTSTATALTVQGNGLTVVTHPWTATELCTFKGLRCQDHDPNQFFGVSARNDPTTRFDGIRIESA